MADPTLKDVLNAIVDLRTETKADFARVDANMSRIEAKVDAVRADVATHRAETRKGFADLDTELMNHAEVVHKELDKEVATLKRRTPAAPRATRPRRSR